MRTPNFVDRVVRASAFFLCSAVFLLRPLNAQTSDLPERFGAIDRYVQEAMQKYKIPGAEVGIVQDDKIAYLKGYGVADDAGRVMTPETPVLLASVSKSFTALCVMQLVEKGKVDLNAPVRRYLPWFRTADVDASSRITIRQLLNHTSGFSTLEGIDPYVDSRLEGDKLEAYVRSLSGVKLIAPPGNRFEYSNTNYSVLGLIIQKISGLSYGDYVQANVFDPLEMKHSHATPAAARADNVAAGYYPFFGMPFVADKIPITQAVRPAAGLYSTAEDMTHYLIAQLNGGRYQGQSIVSEQSIEEMHRPAVRMNSVKDYAMGWMVGPYYDVIQKAIRHDGEGPRSHSFALLVPEKDFGVVWLINVDYPPTFSLFSSLGWGIAEIYMGVAPPSSPPVYEPFLLQNVRAILSVVLIFLGIEVFWFLRWARRRRGLPRRSRHTALGFVLLPALLDLAIAYYLLAILLPQNGVSISATLYFVPDIGWLVIAILVLTIGWGLVRTLLMLWVLFKSGPTSPATIAAAS